MAEIGKEIERITIEPYEVPQPERVTKPEYVPERVTTPDRELVPA